MRQPSGSRRITGELWSRPTARPRGTENRLTDIRGPKYDRMLPSAKNVYLAMMSGDNFLQVQHFLPAKQEFVFWAGAPYDDGTLPPFEMVKRFTVETTCDAAALAGFEPLGHAPRAMLDCDTAVTPPGMPVQHQHGTLTLTYGGTTRTTTPAGTFDVHKVGVRAEFPTYVTDTELLFSDVLGVAVQSDYTNETRNAPTITKTVAHSEVVGIE